MQLSRGALSRDAGTCNVQRLGISIQSQAKDHRESVERFYCAQHTGAHCTFYQEHWLSMKTQSRELSVVVSSPCALFKAPYQVLHREASRAWPHVVCSTSHHSGQKMPGLPDGLVRLVRPSASRVPFQLALCPPPTLRPVAIEQASMTPMQRSDAFGVPTFTLARWDQRLDSFGLAPHTQVGSF